MLCYWSSYDNTVVIITNQDRLKLAGWIYSKYGKQLDFAFVYVGF